MITRSSGLKTLTRSTARTNRSSIARQAMHDRRIREKVLNIVQKDIQKEMAVMCAKKTGSLLRASSPETLQKFTWDALVEELQVNGPTLYNILKGCVAVKRRERAAVTKTKGAKKNAKEGPEGGTKSSGKCMTEKTVKSKRPSDSTVLGMCASILLRHKNLHMNLVQRMVSIMLNNGHSSKQV